MTQGLHKALTPYCPQGVQLQFLTGPPDSPPSINDAVTSIASAHATHQQLLKTGILEKGIDAVLVCCFSAHPLVPMLRHSHPHIHSMHILDTSISHSLNFGTNTFGVLTTGRAMVPDIDAGVRAYMGGVSDRYRGCITTGLGVLELGDPKQRGVVEAKIGQAAANLYMERGAEAIILGCAGESQSRHAVSLTGRGLITLTLYVPSLSFFAGMAGMEGIVKRGIVAAGGDPGRLKIIDGAKAGTAILAGLVSYRHP